MSPLELRHTVESALLPLKSQTAIDDLGRFKVEVEIRPGRWFLAEPVPIETLNSSRAILNFIGSLKHDMQQPVPRAGRRKR